MMSAFPSPLFRLSSSSSSSSDRVDIIGYLIDGIDIRHENSQISIIPEMGRGKRDRERGRKALSPRRWFHFKGGNEPDISPRRRRRTDGKVFSRTNLPNEEIQSTRGHCMHRRTLKVLEDSITFRKVAPPLSLSSPIRNGICLGMVYAFAVKGLFGKGNERRARAAAQCRNVQGSERNAYRISGQFFVSNAAFAFAAASVRNWPHFSLSIDSSPTESTASQRDAAVRSSH